MSKLLEGAQSWQRCFRLLADSHVVELEEICSLERSEDTHDRNTPGREKVKRETVIGQTRSRVCPIVLESAPKSEST